jgi:hypothetical protein
VPSDEAEISCDGAAVRLEHDQSIVEALRAAGITGNDSR